MKRSFAYSVATVASRCLSRSEIKIQIHNTFNEWCVEMFCFATAWSIYIKCINKNNTIFNNTNENRGEKIVMNTIKHVSSTVYWVVAGNRVVELTPESILNTLDILHTRWRTSLSQMLNWNFVYIYTHLSYAHEKYTHWLGYRAGRVLISVIHFALKGILFAKNRIKMPCLHQKPLIWVKVMMLHTIVKWKRNVYQFSSGPKQQTTEREFFPTTPTKKVVS